MYHICGEFRWICVYLSEVFEIVHLYTNDEYVNKKLTLNMHFMKLKKFKSYKGKITNVTW